MVREGDPTTGPVGPHETPSSACPSTAPAVGAPVDVSGGPDAPPKPPLRLNKKGQPDGRYKNGGYRPGAGIKKGTQLRTKRTYNADALAEVVVNKIITGKPIAPTPQTGPITKETHSTLTRIAGESMAVFDARIAEKLSRIADKLADQIEATVDGGKFKPGELGFIFSVMHDKRQSLNGRTSLQNASINVVVNNFGSAPKEQLLSELDGLTHAKNVTEVPTA